MITVPPTSTHTHMKKVYELRSQHNYIADLKICKGLFFTVQKQKLQDSKDRKHWKEMHGPVTTEKKTPRTEVWIEKENADPQDSGTWTCVS